MSKFFLNLSEKLVFGPLRKIPGEERFGNYRYLPIFFTIGATLEFLMCNLKVGPAQVNFYSTLKKRQAIELLDAKEELERSFRTDENKSQ